MSVLQKIYPPYIEGKIPAQVGDVLRIPYQLNRSQGIEDVEGLEIKVRLKVATSNVEVGAGKLKSLCINNAVNYIYTAEINLRDLGVQLDPGQFYKIQLAFANGYYSTVGIFKYTGQPEIQIKDLSSSGPNNAQQIFIGQYNNIEDPAEKPYSYWFNLYSIDNGLIETSGEKLHDYKNGEADSFIINSTLEPNKPYWLNYNVKTLNNLIVSSNNYLIEKIELDILPNLPLAENGFIVDNNYETGTIKGKAILRQQDSGFNLAGTYYILRAEELNGEFNNWSIIKKIILNQHFYSGETINLFTDYTVEQGKNYKYAIQQYSDTVFTDKIESEVIMADFEDMFLYDGERQVNIRFNPKVTSFKTTILQTKTDTMGGRYPVFYRNGSVNYKTFPISGLISRLVEIAPDETRRSSTAAEEDFVYNKPTNLTSNNIYEERKYKLELMEWLNNGKPKLFRSPAEGNYLVKLMDISLSPNDTLGRMLHTFTCNAHEAAELTYENLKKYNFYESCDESYVTLPTIEVFTFDSAHKRTSIEIRDGIVQALIKDTKQDQKITLTFADFSTRIVQVGSTRQYNIFINKANPLIKVESESGILEYVYFKKENHPVLKDGVVISQIHKMDEVVQITDTNSFDCSNKEIKFIHIQNKEKIKIFERNGQKFWNEDSVYPIAQDILNLTTILYYIGDKPVNKEGEAITYSYIIKYNDEDEVHEFKCAPYTSIELKKAELHNLEYIILSDGLYADIYYTEITTSGGEI